MALFEGYGGAHGTHGREERNPDKHDKLEIKKTAKTVREPVTEALWDEHLSGARPIGIIPIRHDNMSMWGCIDVDRYDVDLGALVRVLRERKMPMMVCRSKSGGAHVYLFLEEPVEAAVLQAKLRDLAAMIGLGGSEIFPKQTSVLTDSGDLGNWLNMPYFGGDQTERYCVTEKGRGLTLSQFLTQAEGARQTINDMVGLRATAPADDEYRDGPPCLQHLTASGFPLGTRNNGLFGVATFLKRKHPDSWEQMLESHNQRFFTPPLPSPEVQQIIKSIRQKDYKYKCSDMPLASHCNSGLCRTRRHGVGSSGTMPVMDSLAKLDTDEPVWFLDVGGHRIELSTEELQTPIKFQRKCMEAINIMAPILSRQVWDKIIGGLMENVTLIDAPSEVGRSGQFMEHLESFCTDRQRARDQDELILGKAWHDETTDRIYFRIRDVQEYLEKVRFRDLTRSQMTNRIREHGGNSHFINAKGRGINVFWVPASIFNVQTEAHDIPVVKEDVL